MALDDTARAVATTDAYIRHVAHDLRASLNTVVGWAELVKAGHLSADDSARAGATIVRHARQLSQRLADALDAWRLDIGLLEVDVRRQPVAPAVKAAVEAAGPAFENRQVACDLDLGADAPAAFDPSRLVQALGLLLADAAANTPPGGRVGVQLSRDGDRALIAVRSGGRMPGATAFDTSPRDTRPDPSARTYNFALPLAHTLVARQGGTLQAVPDGEAGVRFLVHLAPDRGPADQVESAATGAPPA